MNKLFLLKFMSICLLASTVCIVSCTKDETIPEEDVEENLDPVGTVYLDEKFDKMIWGGDYILQEPGVRGEFIRDADNKWINDDTQPTSEVVPNLDGSSDFFDTVSEAYRKLRGLDGWEGWKVYERPGYLKLGTASSDDGFIRTPSLEINRGTVELKVSVDLAIWIGASETIGINIVGGGTPSTNQLDVTASDGWTTKEFTVSNATPSTRIELVSDPAEGAGRFFVDNFLVIKSE